jgi:hypothetical protein
VAIRSVIDGAHPLVHFLRIAAAVFVSRAASSARSGASRRQEGKPLVLIVEHHGKPVEHIAPDGSGAALAADTASAKRHFEIPIDFAAKPELA